MYSIREADLKTYNSLKKQEHDYCYEDYLINKIANSNKKRLKAKYQEKYKRQRIQIGIGWIEAIILVIAALIFITSLQIQVNNTNRDNQEQNEITQIVYNAVNNLNGNDCSDALDEILA